MNRIAVTACVALGTVGVLAAAMSGARAGGAKSSSIFDERNLVVTLVTPTLNQEVLPDLGDPGLNNVITVRFSSVLNQRDIIDPQNVVNSLSPSVEFLNSTFLRLPGVPSVRRNVFTFNPFLTTPVLAQGQYTLNFKSSIRNARGRLLNNGGPDYTTSFSVGTDIYPPVLRRVSPVDGQIGIGLQQSVVATFNEPIDLSSILTSITVTDSNTNPPLPIPGKGGTGLTLERNGFDVRFTPDPCFGYPPKSDIQVQIQGTNASNTIGNALSDQFKNKFAKDAGLQWTVDPVAADLFHSPNGTYDWGVAGHTLPTDPLTGTGLFTLHFQTKGTKPSPVGLAPCSAVNGWNIGGSPCSASAIAYAPDCDFSGDNLYYTTQNGLGELDLRAFINRFNQGVTDFSLVSILPNTPVVMGRPGGMVLDRRMINPTIVGGFIVTTPSTFHTFAYVVDEKAGTVNVVRTDNFQVLGRLAGFQSPRDVTTSNSLNLTDNFLWVSNFGANEVVAVSLDGIAVSFSGQPGAAEPCAAIKDNQKIRAFIPVGAGPTEVASDGVFMNSRIMVCNSLGNSMSLVDPHTSKVLKQYDTGSNPVSGDWIVYQTGTIMLGLIANQGGLNDPDGSVQLYIKAPPLQGFFPAAAQTRDDIEGTLTDGVKNPTHVWGNSDWVIVVSQAPLIIDSIPLRWYVSNTGGSTVMQLSFSVTGLFGLSIMPTVEQTLNVGPNPSSTVMDAYYPDAFTFSSVLGTGSLVGVDPNTAIPPVSVTVPGIHRLFNTFTH